MTYTFFFAPEGRAIQTVSATNLTKAKQAFYSTNPKYKKAKGEIYWELEAQVRLFLA